MSGGTILAINIDSSASTIIRDVTVPKTLLPFNLPGIRLDSLCTGLLIARVKKIEIIISFIG